MEDEVKSMIRWVVIIGIILITLVMGGCPRYRVWEQEQTGKAELARAEQNRQIAVQEAMAKKDSAKQLAEAEVIRAEGVAKANAIIGSSLKNNEDYLRYLFVNNLEHTQNQVIYVPTEANLPILEATRKAVK
jgi:regulator of protease activity HflC (stomatin/prohibitin superfamily)